MSDQTSITLLHAHSCGFMPLFAQRITFILPTAFRFVHLFRTENAIKFTPTKPKKKKPKTPRRKRDFPLKNMFFWSYFFSFESLVYCSVGISIKRNFIHWHSYHFWSVVAQVFVWLSSILIPIDLTVNRTFICISFIIIIGRQSNAKSEPYRFCTSISMNYQYTVKYAYNFKCRRKKNIPTKTISTPHSNRFLIEKSNGVF